MSLIFKFAWRYSSYFVAAKSIPNHWDKESYFLWSKKLNNRATVGMIMMNCFFSMFDQGKVFRLISSWDQLSGILTIANLRHVASRIWTCRESEFRLSWLKLCSSDDRYTTVQRWSNIVPVFINNCCTDKVYPK